MIRDDEIERIISYAKGLGIQLVMIRDIRRKKNLLDSATWQADPPKIEVHVFRQTSKTEIVLSLLHELGHHMHWVHNNKPPIPDAYELEAVRKKGEKPLAKSHRQSIYDYEEKGIDYMYTIAVELNLQIPLWKVKLQQELDLWQYYYYLNTGDFPIKAIRKEKRRELTIKHKETL